MVLTIWPGDKNTGYYWTRTFSNDPDRRRGYVMEDDYKVMKQ